jgi:hypothetical protein
MGIGFAVLIPSVSNNAVEESSLLMVREATPFFHFLDIRNQVLFRN